MRPLPSVPGSDPAIDEAGSAGDLPSATAAEVARLTEAAGKLAGAIRASGTPAAAAEALLDDARTCLAEGRSDRAGLLARSALALLGVNEETIARTAAGAAAENEEP